MDSLGSRNTQRTSLRRYCSGVMLGAIFWVPRCWRATDGAKHQLALSSEDRLGGCLDCCFSGVWHMFKGKIFVLDHKLLCTIGWLTIKESKG